MFVFQKIWRGLFFWDTRFKIRPFALLPTISEYRFQFSWNKELLNTEFSQSEFTCSKPAMETLQKYVKCVQV